MFTEKTINLVISQTNYDRETAINKLNNWNGDYLSVIKEYLNPNFRKKKKKKETKNQRVISSIRNFMDDVSKGYNKREKIKMELELKNKIEEEGKKHQEEFEKRIKKEDKKEAQIIKKNLNNKKKTEIDENKTDGIEINEL